MNSIFYSLAIFFFVNIAKGNEHQAKESFSRNAEKLREIKTQFPQSQSNENPLNEISIPTSKNTVDVIQFNRNDTLNTHIKKILNSDPFLELTTISSTSLNQTFRKQPNIHISEFTNPKTGLNPFLDLIEGTANNTRNTSLTNSPKRIVHVIFPSKKINKPKSDKDFKNPLADKRSMADYDRHIPTDLHNNWLHHGKMHLDPVEGDSGRRSLVPFESIEEPTSKRNNIFHLGTLNVPTLPPRVNRKLPALHVNSKNDRPYDTNFLETSTRLSISNNPIEKNESALLVENELEKSENNHSSLPNVTVIRLRPKNTTPIEFGNLAPKIIPVITCVTIIVLAFLFAVHFCNKRSQKKVSNPNSITFEARRDRTENIYDQIGEPHLPLNKEVIK